MYELKVEGMMCGGCASNVEKAIRRLDPGADVKVDLAAGKVSVESAAERTAVSEAIAAAGYDVVS
jgi:copper chaperone